MSKKIYKYTITVFSTSDQAGNMLLDSLNKGDEYASDYELDECDETDLPQDIAVLGHRFVSAEYAEEVREREAKRKNELSK